MSGETTEIARLRAELNLASNLANAGVNAIERAANLEAEIARLREAMTQFSERFHRRLWRVLNEPISDDIYISKNEAQQWMGEIDRLVAALASPRPEPQEER